MLFMYMHVITIDEYICKPKIDCYHGNQEIIIQSKLPTSKLIVKILQLYVG